MNYTVNLTNTYKNGYRKGFEDGKEAARNKLIETCLETLVMLLVDAEWANEDMQEFADRFSRGITYNCCHPEEWKRMVEQVSKEKDIRIVFHKE